MAIAHPGPFDSSAPSQQPMGTLPSGHPCRGWKKLSSRKGRRCCWDPTAWRTNFHSLSHSCRQSSGPSLIHTKYSTYDSRAHPSLYHRLPSSSLSALADGPSSHLVLVILSLRPCRSITFIDHRTRGCFLPPEVNSSP